MAYIAEVVIADPYVTGFKSIGYATAVNVSLEKSTLTQEEVSFL